MKLYRFSQSLATNEIPTKSRRDLLKAREFGGIASKPQFPPTLKLVLDENPEAFYSDGSNLSTAFFEVAALMGNIAAETQLWKREQNEAAEAGLNPFRKAGGTPTG